MAESVEFMEGFDALHENQDRNDNPYNDGTKEHRDWAAGWEKAESELPE